MRSTVRRAKAPERAARRSGPMRHPPGREVSIRALNVSIVVVAAVVASLAVVRGRAEEPARTREKRPEPPPAAIDLDQLRNAGF